ncbi:serine hydrolase domain-containing protein [Myxococcota bacterium]
MKKLKRLFVATVLGSTFFGCHCPSEPRSKIDSTVRHRALIEKFRVAVSAAMVEEKVPGLSVAVVGRDSVIWKEGFGVTHLGGERRIDTDTIFSLQSTSKTVTTTAILLAIQAGLLELDQPISRYVPTFKVNSRFDEIPSDKITLRHLLEHQTG